MAKKGDKFRKFTKEFKLKAVKMYLEEGYGIEEVTHKLGLNSRSYLKRWLKNYNEHGEAGLEERRGKSESPHRGRPKKDPTSPEERLKWLEAENDYLKALLECQKEKIKKKRSGESSSS